MADWRVKLIGDSVDLEALSYQFASSATQIIKDEDGYWLKSTDFEGLSREEEVRARTDVLLQIINGAGLVFLSGFRPVDKGHLVRIGDDGIRHNSVSFAASASFRASVVVEIKDAQGNVKPQDALPKDVEFASMIAQSEDAVRRALTFFGKEHGWVNFYKVFELIRADVGGERELSSRSWTTRAQASRFTQTANSAGAVGDAARHAVETTQPPARPMTLEEAEEYIRSLLIAWIRSKR